MCVYTCVLQDVASLPSMLHVHVLTIFPSLPPSNNSSLSSVEPPQVWFDLKLPSHVIEEVQLSSLQLEAVVYACQQHMNILSDGSRAGFLIGELILQCGY